MNFYAHLVAASWQSEDFEFALGAMLPDFANMAGFRLAPNQPDSVARGIEFHHHSDKAFHRLPSFRNHERWTLQHLLAAGLRRGPARGVAHVGVELCLDGALLGQADALYLRALACATTASLRWRAPEEAEVFATLIARLREIGVPQGYADPSVVSQRLVRIFGPRPLLAFQDQERALLDRAMPLVHRRVGEDSRAIMQSLQRAL